MAGPLRAAHDHSRVYERPWFVLSLSDIYTYACLLQALRMSKLFSYILIFCCNLLLCAHARDAVKVCRIHPSVDGVSDDAPAIRKAFEECKENGHIIFDDATFHVESVLQTTGLSNVVIDLNSTLLVRQLFLVLKFVILICIVGKQHHLLES